LRFIPNAYETGRFFRLFLDGAGAGLFFFDGVRLGALLFAELALVEDRGFRSDDSTGVKPRL
jgi:hypothetical protein